jgi:predicted Holliday junction resolvase-like endonuclease
MLSKRKQQEFIDLFSEDDLFTCCPNCEETVALKRCGLFYGDNFTESAISIINERVAEQKERLAELKRMQENVSVRSETGAKAVNLGRIWERLIPFLPTFPYDSTACRPLFDPLDHIVFEGLSRLEVTQIIFLEIKTGQSRLNGVQRKIKSLVEQKKISALTYKCGGGQ